MAEGYELEALHYLMKPVSREKLFALLDRAEAAVSRNARAVLLPTAEGTTRLLLRDIRYAEALGHTAAVYTPEALETRLSLSALEKLLGEDFVLCHRSYLASLRWIRQISRDTLLLDGGVTLPLARNRVKPVSLAFIRCWQEDTP